MIRFAVQAKPGEVEYHLAELVIRTAARLNLEFKFLEAVDWVTFGSTKMLIMGADVRETNTLLTEIAKEGRGYIRMEFPNYFAYLGTRKAPIPSNTMLMAKRLSKVFRGTLDPFWERQFRKT